VDDRIARTRAVNVVRRGTLLALIDKGVAEGERVIIYPGEAVRDGAKVSVSNR
jgi:HlyD family secretion protein